MEELLNAFCQSLRQWRSYSENHEDRDRDILTDNDYEAEEFRRCLDIYLKNGGDRNKI